MFADNQKKVEIHYNIESFSGKKPVVTIGTFDGIHLGHQKVIKRLKEIAEKVGGKSVIFTFSPHPRMVTAPDKLKLKFLTTLDEKIELFRKAEVDHLIIYPFTKKFAEMNYSEFVKTILVDKIKTQYLVIGYDHRFGKNREGSFEYLQKCANQYNFIVEKLDPLLSEGYHISSTRIRMMLKEGNIVKANELLGYRYFIHGRVVEGTKLGRKIGFPTANIELSDINKLIPGIGVYAVEAASEGTVYKGMLNIGTRPTFNKNKDKKSIEVNLFDFSGDLYHKQITLYFAAKIRDEQKFSGATALAEQLKKDKIKALQILS